jgi:hypothetical protein
VLGILDLSQWFYAAAELFTEATESSVVELFNRSVQVDLEIGGQLAEPRILDGFKVSE